MRVLRTFFWAALLAAGFVYVTGGNALGCGPGAAPGTQRGAPVERADPRRQSAGYSTDEQNNIDIYKSARDATVNITSVVYHT